MIAAVQNRPAIVQSDRQRPRSVDELSSSVSASRISVWQQCRLKFFFRYVLALRKPKSPALHVGRCVHSVLKHWNKARWRNEQSSLKQLHDVYSSSWADEQKLEPVNWDGAEEEQKKTGWRLLETYFRQSGIQPDEKPEAVEVAVEADLKKHGLPTLVGIIDLVRPSGRIVDFKTSGKTPNGDNVAHLNDTQTTTYSMLYREATGKKESAIELHHLIKNKNPKLVITSLDPATETQKNRLFKIIESYVKGLRHSDWIPSPGIQCASCEFFHECRAWS
jgi:CRISPR/Cas system-associated exonuclease Cas4 (RecB family)